MGNGFNVARRGIGTLAIVAGISWCQIALGGEPVSGREQPVEFCLFRSFGLNDDERSLVRALINNSDGSQAHRKAIYERYNSFCAGQEYPLMVGCLSFAADVRDCLSYLPPNKPTRP